MSAKQVPIYRLPIMPKQHVGYISVKKDRNGKVYIAGSRVESSEEAGEFRVLTAKDGHSYIVIGTE
ncbi:MAG: hypothetical protein H7Z42_12600, partial [Roseiflexaceae bacterium]|nr:hypothetical protein [Roseiflexaceae bacterium]